MKWHYLKNEDYPKWYADIIVKCADGDVLKTGYSSYDDDKDYNHKPFAVSFYDDEGFDADIGSLKWINVVAWCPFEEIEEYLNLHNLWRNRDDECDYFNNLGIIVSTTDDGESVVTIPAIGKVINGERRFYELYEDGLPVGVVYGWVEIGDIWTILDRD